MKEMAVLMIRPVRFGYNAQTAVNNAFQQEPAVHDDDIQQRALAEFDRLVAVLRSHGVEVLVMEDTPELHTPDSIFPNNWISFHDNGDVFLYPMFAENRRAERKAGVLEAIKQTFMVRKLTDLTFYEQRGRFLEGTGSIVPDRQSRIAYACLSPRTDKTLLREWCRMAGYRPYSFRAHDRHGTPVYHTNVMMCVADEYAVVCLESIRSEEEREHLSHTLKETGKTVIPISLAQMEQFAGNMLQVSDREGRSYAVMSSQAFHSLTEAQLTQISHFNAVLHSPLDTIETNGGGSARCMMAEIYLPRA
jgi:hypothetical protein